MQRTVEILTLHSEGEKGGIPFSISSVPASVLMSVLDRVPKLITGSRASAKTKSLVGESLSYSFENGSFKVTVIVLEALLAALRETAFFSDFKAISEGRMEIVSDTSRIESLRDLRGELMSNGAKTIELSSAAADVSTFDLAGRQVELSSSDDPWVDSESYVMATVVDMGGKSKANAHLELDNGKLVVADSARNYLAALEDNLLYKKVLAHVAYRVNLRTKEWGGVRLVSLSLPGKKFDVEAFERAVSSPSAWDEVEDPVAEIRRMRGDDV